MPAAIRKPPQLFRQSSERSWKTLRAGEHKKKRIFWQIGSHFPIVHSAAYVPHSGGKSCSKSFATCMAAHTMWAYFAYGNVLAVFLPRRERRRWASWEAALQRFCPVSASCVRYHSRLKVFSLSCAVKKLIAPNLGLIMTSPPDFFSSARCDAGLFSTAHQSRTAKMS